MWFFSFEFALSVMAVVMTMFGPVDGFATHSGTCNAAADVGMLANNGGMNRTASLSVATASTTPNSAFDITISPVKYVAGAAHTITLARKTTMGSGTGGFRGMLLYVEDAQAARVGTWDTTSNMVQTSTLAGCNSGATITHTSMSVFTSSQGFTWTAPMSLTGAITIKAIVWETAPTRQFNIPQPLNVVAGTAAPSGTPTTGVPTDVPTLAPTTAPNTQSPASQAPSSMPTSSPATANPTPGGTTAALTGSCAGNTTKLGINTGVGWVLSTNATHALLIISGPRDVWFGVGYGTQMRNSVAIIYKSDTDIKVYDIANRTIEGIIARAADKQPTVMGISVSTTTRTVCLSAPLAKVPSWNAGSSLVFARGLSAVFANHGNAASHRGQYIVTVTASDATRGGALAVAFALGMMAILFD